MYKNINWWDFDRAFLQCNRETQFSYEGRQALFGYLEGYEEDTGETIDLDVISLCCSYEEYENIEDYLGSYTNTDIEKDDYEDEEELKAAIKENIRNNTTLIEIEDSEGFIIGQY